MRERFAAEVHAPAAPTPHRGRVGEHAGDCLGSSAVRPDDRVPVDVERHAHARVSDALGHVTHGEARSEGLGHVPVAQVVQAATETEATREAPETIREDVRAQRLRRRRVIGEYVRVVLEAQTQRKRDLRLRDPVGAEEAHGLVVERDPPGVVRLGRLHDDPARERHDRPTDHEALALEVGPPQSAELTAASACDRGEPHGDAEVLAVVTSGREDAPHLLRGRRIDLVPVDLRWGRERRRVAADPAPPLGVDERPAQDRVHLADRRRREGSAVPSALVPEGPVEPIEHRRRELVDPHRADAGHDLSLGAAAILVQRLG